MSNQQEEFKTYFDYINANDEEKALIILQYPTNDENMFFNGMEQSKNILRRSEYPSIQEQLDMLWHGMNADETKRIEPFYSFIKDIKEKFPKVVK